jgi:type IV pilus assembly protein PilN
MRKINLLDWRTDQIKQNQKETGMAAIAAVALGLGAWLLVKGFYTNQINFQNQKNAHIEKEIKILDKQIEEVNALEETKAKLISRMNIIDSLQKSRPEVVRLFDDMVRVIPDGTFLRTADQTNTTINFVGETESSTRVATLMRNIEAATTLNDADLVGSGIVNKNVGRKHVSEFKLSAKQVSSQPSEEDAE